MAIASAAVMAPPADAPVRTAAVGEPLLSEAGAGIAGLRLAAPVNVMNRTLSAGFYPQIGEDERFTWHSFLARPDGSGRGAVGGLRDVRRLRADKARARLCVIVGSGLPLVSYTLCDTEQGFTRATEPDPLGPPARQLIYAGRAGGLIRLIYREGAGAPIELTYDNPLPGMLCFKAARIEVLHADAGTIRYRVLAGWDRAPAE